MKLVEESLTKQFQNAVSRAEDAEKRLGEKTKQHQTIQAQLRDAKVLSNDLSLKLKTIEAKLKAAEENGQRQVTTSSSGHKYSYEEVYSKYDSLKYSYKKIEEAKNEAEKHYAEI